MPTRSRRSAGQVVRAYVALTKPRIIELLLVTTLPTMFLAAQGLPPLGLTVATLIGGALAAGGANALNCYLDRDIDQVMRRTAHRPLASGDVSTSGALVFGLALSALSVFWLALLVNPLAAGLAALAILFYVVVYTMGLKRRTPQNIVWGGAAGCFPVLIGWAAVTNSLDWAPWILFLIIFLWTPPHYWPLSLRFRDDYNAAGVPMLGAVADAETVATQIIWYSWAMVGASLLLIPVAPMSWLYALVAVVSGALFLQQAYVLRRRVRSAAPGEPVGEMRLFHYSITYLAVLFLAVALDPLFF